MKLLLPLIVLLFLSCHSGKDLSKKWDVPLAPKSDLNLNGTFENVGLQEGKHSINLWSMLNSIPARSKYFVDSINTDTSLFVDLQWNKESNHLKAYLVFNEYFIDSLEYSGEVIDNYFFVDQSSKKLFLPPLFWYVNHSEMIISGESNDSLSLTHLSWGSGGSLIFMGDGGGTNRSKYKRKVE